MVQPMKRDHIEGLDYIRATMSIFVVCWHIRVAGVSGIFYKSSYLDHQFCFTDFLNFHIFLLSVHAFILVSNYLFAADGAGVTVLIRRVARIMVLLTFWTAAYLIVSHGLTEAIKTLQASDRSLVVLIVRAGGTIYYFFVSIIICYLATFVIAKTNTIVQGILFVLSVGFLEAAPYIADATGGIFLCSYWSPSNFIPYAFAAVILAKYRAVIDRNRLLVVLAATLISLALAVWEWHYSIGDVIFLAEKQGIPSYTRGSLVFGAIAVLVLATDKRIRSGRVIKFMSTNSLALYCIHPFFIESIKGAVRSGLGPVSLSLYVSTFLVIVTSYLTAMVLRLYLKREVIE